MPSVSITAAVIGAAGAVGSASMAKSGSKKASDQAMTGYNYLTTGAGAPTIKAAQDAGIAATNNETQSLAGQKGVYDTMNSLLTSDNQNTPAFHVLKKGQVPPMNWLMAYSGKNKDASTGPKASVVRLGDVGQAFTCDQVRAAFPAN